MTQETEKQSPQSPSSLSYENLYLRLRDETKAREFLETRVDVLEYFIKKQFPEFFAGEVGTIADPNLKPVVIDPSAPLLPEGAMRSTRQSGLVPLEESHAER